jgi:hypothetical protein
MKDKEIYDPVVLFKIWTSSIWKMNKENNDQVHIIPGVSLETCSVILYLTTIKHSNKICNAEESWSL